jgi:hypothetical protein
MLSLRDERKQQIDDLIKHIVPATGAPLRAAE